MAESGSSELKEEVEVDWPREVPLAHVYTHFTLKDKPASSVAPVALLSNDLIIRWKKAYSQCA